jgi:ribosomal-protein-alanine N-acetyltransferase
MSDIAPLDPATADFAALAELHGASFDEKWSAQSLRSLLETPGTFGFAIAASDKVAGFVLVRLAADEAEILTLAVDPQKRRKGHAKRLTEAAGAYASQRGAGALFLEVGVNNKAAYTLYDSLGFRRVGARPAYYARNSGPAEDALILRADLPLASLGKSPGLG